MYVDRGALNSIMEFDHVIEVRDGEVFDAPPNVYAPSILNEELNDTTWSFFTHGYSGQYNYSGPIMHDSEFIGGYLARDILAQDGLYVAVYAIWDCADCVDKQDADCASCHNDGSIIEGWAVAYRPLVITEEVNVNE